MPIPTLMPEPIAHVEGEIAHLVELKQQTAAAREHAERVRQRAAIELKRAEAVLASNLSRTHVTHRVSMSAEISKARSWLGDPLAARRAVIASVILGPPVGL